MRYVDPWGHRLREEIKILVQKLDMETAMKSESLRELFQLAREDGLEEGEKKGEKKGERKGVRKGRAQLAEELLSDQLVRDLRRDLTAAERKLLAARARVLSTGELRELLTDTAPDTLRLRLLGPDGA